MLIRLLPVNLATQVSITAAKKRMICDTRYQLTMVEQTLQTQTMPGYTRITAYTLLVKLKRLQRCPVCGTYFDSTCWCLPQMSSLPYFLVNSTKSGLKTIQTRRMCAMLTLYCLPRRKNCLSEINSVSVSSVRCNW